MVAIPAAIVTSIGLLHPYSVLGVFSSENCFTSKSVRVPVPPPEEAIVNPFPLPSSVRVIFAPAVTRTSSVVPSDAVSLIFTLPVPGSFVDKSYVVLSLASV